MEKLLAIQRNNFILFLFLLYSFQGIAQEKKSEFTIRGYVKYLPSYLDYDAYSHSKINHLIHNRINLKKYFKEHFSIGFELRSRMVYGDNINISNDAKSYPSEFMKDFIEATYNLFQIQQKRIEELEDIVKSTK